MNVKSVASMMVGLLAISVLFIFIFMATGLPLPLPLSQEQRTEIAAYAPKEDGMTMLQNTLWKIGDNAQLKLTETILVKRHNGQISVSHYCSSSWSWDIAKSWRDHALQERLHAIERKDDSTI